MDNWQRELLDVVEIVTDEVGLFFQNVTETVDSFFEFTEEFSQQVQTTIFTEVDQFLQEFVEPFFDPYLDLGDLTQDIDLGFPYYVDPTQQKNAACIGCRHYHGQVYSGNLLVCGMHPYGWDDGSCPDWETENLNF